MSPALLTQFTLQLDIIDILKKNKVFHDKQICQTWQIKCEYQDLSQFECYR